MARLLKVAGLVHAVGATESRAQAVDVIAEVPGVTANTAVTLKALVGFDSVGLVVKETCGPPGTELLVVEGVPLDPFDRLERPL